MTHPRDFRERLVASQRSPSHADECDEMRARIEAEKDAAWTAHHDNQISDVEKHIAARKISRQRRAANQPRVIEGSAS